MEAEVLKRLDLKDDQMFKVGDAIEAYRVEQIQRTL